MDINFVLKVQDTKMSDVQKALQAAGIKVTSIIEVFKEGLEAKPADEVKAQA
ncbi:MAG: hypothetical protein HY806_03575 [Nitrospirae bacterium]|nr:hypothetical protein [Nitrospirota bacterium]MBI4838217.1 hypothetical protein [Nitrospirota bacterium]